MPVAERLLSTGRWQVVATSGSTNGAVVFAYFPSGSADPGNPPVCVRRGPVEHLFEDRTPLRARTGAKASAQRERTRSAHNRPLPDPEFTDRHLFSPLPTGKDGRGAFAAVIPAGKKAGVRQQA